MGQEPQNRKKIRSLASPFKEIAEEEKSLQFKNFVIMYAAINGSNLAELKNSLYEYAVRYSRLRVDQLLADDELKNILDEERTRAHNAFIDACNIMSRNMLKNGEDASWRKELGDDRKVIGDFACYINYVLGIKAR